MKTKDILFLLFLFCATTIAQAQDFDSFYKKYSDKEGITAVYISKNMLNLARGQNFGNLGSINFKAISGKVESVQILTSEKEKVKDELAKEISAITKNGYEILMQVKENGEMANFYVKNKSNNIISEFIISVNNSKETVFVRISGNFTAEDLRKIIPPSD